MTDAPKPNTFLDFEIRILARRDDHYPVHITLGQEQNFTGEISINPSTWASTGNAQTDGQRLFATLFTDPELRHAWDEARGQSLRRRIRLWIDTDAPELHALPWELLHDDTTWLAADAVTPFSRYLPSAAPWGGLVTERPIRILTVIFNPADLAQYHLAPLDVHTERALLVEALGDLLILKHFHLEHLEAPATLERLEKALASGPHVLHFVGHGAFSQRQGQATLYLQDAADNTQIVTETQLSEMLRRQESPPRLIFLAACQSAERSTTDAFAGLAPRLVQTGISAVVAMQDLVAIQTTHKMTPVFYEELARHGEVDRALNKARSNLLTAAQPDAAVPAIFMRLDNGKLWEPLWTATNPYCGLAAFTENDADFFFGREQLITELSDKARRQRFIAVVGSSGSGKSSVVQAGLFPRLPKDWKIVKMRPGADPYATLAATGLQWTQNAKAQGLNLQLETGNLQRLLLFIDQFEELFALCPLDVQTRFLTDLQALVESDAPVTLILTLRADFYGHLQDSSLGQHLEYAMVNVLQMTPEDLCAAIEQPAQKVGLHFEVGLVETLIRDTQCARHALPLLQFALTQLWERQAQGMLTDAAYREISGVAGAIGLWAEDTYNGLTATEQQLAHRVFTRLVHYGEDDAADTRQRRPLTELLVQPDERNTLHRLLQQLADKRLLTTDKSLGLESVEIIHDALLREWPRLERWLTEQREFHLWRQRLDERLHEWREKKGELLREASLVEAERWLQEKPDELSEQERTYIRAGIDDRERERQAEELHRRRILRGVMTAAMLFLVLAVVARMGWHSSATKEQARATAQAEAAAEANRALNAEATAQAEATRALSAETMAEARRQDAENAQATAEAERDRAEQQVQISLARQLSAQAQTLQEQWGQHSLYLPRALLLMAESLLRYPDGAISQVLIDGIALLPPEVAQLSHEDCVNVVAFSSDGQSVVSGGQDGVAKVWEVETGHALAWVKHEGGVLNVAFSPDGQWVVSGGQDNIARVWVAKTGREIAQITHEGRVRTVSFSPDGRWIVSGGEDSIAKVWEAATGQEVARMVHRDSVTTVAFSPDGRRIVSGSLDHTIRIWEAQSGREITRMTHENVSVLAYSPDGRWVVSGSSDGTVKVWETETWNNVAQMFHEAEVTGVAFSPDGQWVVSGSWDYTARVWEVETGYEVARRRHAWRVSAVAFSPDGQLVVSGGWDDTAWVWEAGTGRVVAPLIHLSIVTAVAFSPDGHRVVSGGLDGARVWDIAAMLTVNTEMNRIVAGMMHEGKVACVTFSPDGRRVASGSQDGTARVWETETGHEIARMTHKDGITAIAFSPDGRWVISGSKDGVVKMWEAETGYEVTQLFHEGEVTDVAFSPDGRWGVLVGCNRSQDYRCNGGGMQLWETKDGLIAAQVTYEDGVLVVAFSPDGELVALGGGEGVVRVWQVETGHVVARMTHWSRVNTLAFSPDGQWVISGGQDGIAQVWEAETGRAVTQLEYEWWVTTVAFSPDGYLVASAGCNRIENYRCSDASVRVWETETGNEVSRMQHEGEITALAFSLDGRWVVSGSYDGTARVWEAQTGREIAHLSHNSEVLDTAFSPDGRWVVSGGEDGKIWVWWWRPEDLIDIACSRLTRNLTHEEWQQYLGDEPYRATCPNLPIPEE